jgi:ABC-type transporter Mla maintaining outer membrane lipid asymmetry permease subunit MlaE
MNILLNHNVAGNQPISELISSIDLAFHVGIVLGFFIGMVFGIFVYACYRDFKEGEIK